MKCKNCGAELKTGKCAYCGSVFFETCYVYLDGRAIYTAIEKAREEETIDVTCLGDDEPHYIRGK